MGGVEPSNERTDPPNNALEQCHEVPRPSCKEQDISLDSGPGSILRLFQVGGKRFQWSFVVSARHVLWLKDQRTARFADLTGRRAYEYRCCSAGHSNACSA